jgi:hypothetical protein
MPPAMRRLLTKLPLPSHVMKGLSRRQWHRVYSAAWQYVVQGHLDRQWQRIDSGLPPPSDEHVGLHRLNSRVAQMLDIMLVAYPLMKSAADSDAGLMPSLETVDDLREAIRWELRRKRRYMLDQHLVSLAQLEALESLALAVERGLANKTDAMRGALRATQLKVAMDERVRRRLQPPPSPPPSESESESESSPSPPAGADMPPPQPSGRRSRRRKRAAAAAQLEEPILDKPERGSTRRMGRAGAKIVNEASAAFGQGIIHQWFWWRLEAASPGLRRARTLLATGTTAASSDVPRRLPVLTGTSVS